MRVAACLLSMALVCLNPVDLRAKGSENRVSEPPPANAERLAQGIFRDGDPVHRGSGQLLILKTSDGDMIARLENLEVVPGPDLFVYLVRDPDPLFPEDVSAGFVSLGPLKGRTGDQNYAVARDIKISEWGSVVVWCDTFDVAFAVASIEPR
jgi:hypothetical protein